MKLTVEFDGYSNANSGVCTQWQALEQPTEEFDLFFESS
jgi:hypothetical protein